MNRNNCIFISINKNFLEQLKICLYSIAKNYKNHPDIILCYIDLSKKEINELNSIVKIIPIENTLNEQEIGPVMKHLKNVDPKVFYARFLIRRLPIFQKYQGILHLDADTIILKNCDEIFNNTEFYIEQEAYNGEDKIFIDNNNQILINKISKDKIDFKKNVGNAGVFMISKKYININIYNELINILKDYKDYIKRADQSILNIWLLKKGIQISTNKKFNFQHRFVVKSSFDNFFKDAYIVHFNGVYDGYRIFFMKIGFYLFYSKFGRIIYRFIYSFFTLIYNH